MRGDSESGDGEEKTPWRRSSESFVLATEMKRIKYVARSDVCISTEQERPHLKKNLLPDEDLSPDEVFDV